MGLCRDILDELPASKKKSIIQIILNYFFSHPFKIMINIRMGQRFSKSGNPFLRLYSRFLKNRQMYRWSCDISYNAKIGKGVIFGHPLGIVIGHEAVIEDNVRIWQNVTLGSHGKGSDSDAKHYPTIRKGAKIFTGAIIIGGVTIGENAIVAANAVVNIDVPDGCIAVGIPCKIIERK